MHVFLYLFSKALKNSTCSPRLLKDSSPLQRGINEGRSVDIETGDLILEEAHQQEHWVIKRNMMGQIIDLHRIDADDDIRQIRLD